MFRIAQERDIDRIAEIYGHIHDSEEAGQAVVGWKRTIYPTRGTAEEAVARGEMFVGEDGGTVVAAARINQRQEESYARGSWLYDVPAREVMVLHTLAVDPVFKGRQYGAGFVKFYEQYAASHGCSCLRIDTNEKNAAARAFYKRLGFREAGVVSCVFNGLPDVRLVLLEKKLFSLSKNLAEFAPAGHF